MKKRHVYSPLTAGLVCASLAFTAAPAVAQTVPTDVSYSNMVLNIGSTEQDRAFAWYADGDEPDATQVRLTDIETGVVQLLNSEASGTSLDQPDLVWNHASVTGLIPGTTYTWEVGSAELGWSDAYTFTTQSDDRLDVLVFGDTQIGSGGGVPSDGEAWADALESSLAQVPNPDFLLSVGDQVNTHDDAGEYLDYLAPDALREHALATNIGNHDDGSASDAQHSYAEHFAMPNRTANPGWNNEMGNYWYLQGDTLFVSLNSNERDPAAHEQWLRDVVAEQGQDVAWKVATWHHALYSTASHATDRDVEERREWLPPLMSELDFDVVMSGHDHVYNRSNLLNAGHPVGDLTGPAELMKYEDEVLYFTHQSSSGSKYYTIQTGPNFTYNAVESQNRVPTYSHLEIAGDELSVTTYQVDGEVIDAVTLSKAPAGTTKPIENQRPDEPAQTVFRNEGPLPYDDPVDTVYREDTDDYLVEGRVLNANDDVEESRSDGELDMTSSDLELVHEYPDRENTNPQNVGIRFSLLDIPAGAEITSAYIQFTVDEPNKSGDPFNVQIHVEDTGNAAQYDEFEEYNVSTRDYVAAAIDWVDAPVWTTAQEAGEDQRTPDISTLVQAATDHAEWDAGNSMAFMLNGDGTRTAESYNGGGSNEAPKLMVTYELPTDEPTPEDPEGDREAVIDFEVKTNNGRFLHISEAKVAALQEVNYSTGGVVDAVRDFGGRDKTFVVTVATATKQYVVLVDAETGETEVAAVTEL